MLLNLIASFALGLASTVSKTDCTSQELKSKRCLTQSNENKVEIKKDHIFIFSKNKKVSVIENPFSSDQAEWSKIHFTEEKGKKILILEAWDMPGESGQNLTQVTYQIEKGSAKALSTRILQTRVWDTEKKEYVFTPKAELPKPSSQ